jgi:exonuclease SbcC
MLPKRLTLKNFLLFESVELDFTKIRKALILGIRDRNSSLSNGSGKSNLLRAIPWCVWGYNPEAKTVDQNVRWGADSCLVKFEFEHNGHQASITRTRSLKSNSSTLDFIIDDVVSNGSSIDDTNQKIINFLNLDYNAYINSVYINQNDLFSLANSKDKNESRELLERLLGLNEYDEYFETAKEVNASFEEARKLIVDYLNQYKDIDQQEKSNDEAIEEMRESMSIKTTRKDSLSLNLTKLGAESDAISRFISDKNSYAEKIESAEKILKEKTAGLETFIQRARDFKESLDKKKAQNAATIATYDGLVKERESLTTKMAEIVAISGRVTDLDIQIGEKSEELALYSERLTALEKEMGAIQQQGKSEKKTIDENESKKGNPSLALGSKCDFCYTDITNDTLDHYYGHLNKKIEEGNVRMAELKVRAGQKSGEIGKVKSLIESLNKDIKGLRNEKETLIAGAAQEASIKYQMSHVDKKMKEVEEARADQEKISTGKEVEEWKKSVLSKKQEVEIMRADLEKMKADSHIDDEYHSKVDRLNQVKMDINLSNIEIGRIQSDLKTMEGSLVELRKKKGNFDIIRQDIAGKNIELQQVNKKIALCQELMVAFSPKGIRYHVLGTAIEDLEKEANEILPQISNGSLHIFFETKKEVKKSKTGQSEKLVFDAYINDGQKTQPFSAYSGGEQLRISFVIRVALSKLLLKRANSELEFLILDESLSPLDAAGVEAMIMTINQLQQYFKKIFVITHRNDVKQYFDDIITVKRDNFTSKVEI